MFVVPPLAIDLGRGVFETVLVVNGVAVALERHLHRLASSVGALFGAPLPPAVAERASERVAARDRARLRIVAVPRAGGVDVDLEVADAPAESPRIAALEPVLLAGGLGAHKWRDRGALERLERTVAPSVPLLVDDDDVLEATRANVFVVRDGALVTPPADGRLLGGITRARVLETAVRLGVPAHEEPVRLDDLRTADEVFLTSAIRGVVSVDRPGPLAARLAEALR